MTDSSLLLIPSPATQSCRELDKGLSNSQAVILVDPSILESCWKYMTLFTEASQLFPDCISIFPLGCRGEYLWNHLAPSAAMWAVPLFSSAVVAIPSGKLPTVDCDFSVWQWMLGEFNSLQIHDAMPVGESPLILWPELSPHHSRMPNWLKQLCLSRFSKDAGFPDRVSIGAGFFQMYDDLDRSHDFAQAAQGQGKHAAGDYWHGIMHRREPDYGNAKYWFRRLGNHPIHAALAAQAEEILHACAAPAANNWNARLTARGWNAFAFVDLCEECAAGADQDLLNAAKEIQWREMVLLLEQTILDFEQT